MKISVEFKYVEMDKRFETHSCEISGRNLRTFMEETTCTLCIYVYVKFNSLFI